MRQLDTGNAPPLSDKIYDSCQRFNLFITPEPEIMGADTPLRGYCDRFGKNKAGTADRTTAEVDKVPIIGRAVNA
jgi:hypothetical protein